MRGSLYAIFFLGFYVVYLNYLGSQISDLYIYYGFNERNIGSGLMITEIGMDFGINRFELILNWCLGSDLSRSWCTLQVLSSGIVMDSVLQPKRLRRVTTSDSSGFSVNLMKPQIRCLIAFFLPQGLWGILQAKGFIFGIDQISVHTEVGSFRIFLLRKLLAFKGSDGVMLKPQISSFLFASFLSASLSISLSGVRGFLFHSFVVISLWVLMSQSSLLGKDSVEKSLGAVVSKMRIKIPSFDNSALIKGYAKTMIGRCMNPRMQDMRGLLLMFPRICQVEGRVAVADLGLGRFQFDFDEEDDIVEVLKMEPFHFDGWMVSLVRWKQSVDPSYPSTITFWVHVLGIPIEYLAHTTFESIGDALGKVVKVDINGGRVKVILDGYKPLCFETTIEFDSGEETLISLRYERLYGYCSYCFSLCHDVEHCEKKHGIRMPPHHTVVGVDGAGAQNWSYKGAVVQDRQPKHGNDGKGKGIATGKDRDEERVVSSNSKANDFGKGKQSKFVKGEGSSRYKRFTNYANFNDHRFNEQKKLKAKAKDASKVKVVDSSEGQAVQTVAIKPKKIVRKSLVFEDEAGGSSEQQLEHKEQGGGESQVAEATEEVLMDQLPIQNDLELLDPILELPVANTDLELVMSQSEEGVMAVGNMELEIDADTDNLLDSEISALLEQVVSNSEAVVSELVEKVMGPIEGVDNPMIIADQRTATTKVSDKGKGKEVSVAKKKTGRGIVLPGVTTRKRIVQALVSPRKRPAPKHGSNQGDDNFPPDQGHEKGGAGGSQPPQPSD